MRFDLTDLKLFLHVVEAGSITAGAERMHLAVAAASTRIRNMEIELGTALLNRDRQGVQPTPAGRTLVHHARLLLQQAERMRGELSEYADGLKGHIRLLSNTNALTEFLPEPLSQFLASHPQVNIDLEERLSDEIVAAVADRQGRHRHRRRHRGRHRPGSVSVPRRSLRAGDGARRIRSPQRGASRSPTRSIATSSAWTAPARCSGFCRTRPSASAAG